MSQFFENLIFLLKIYKILQKTKLKNTVFFLLKNFAKFQENFEMLNFSKIPDLLHKQNMKIPAGLFQVKVFGNIPGIWSH